MAQELLKNGYSHAKDLYSAKTGKNFEADILMGVKDGKVDFSLAFPQKKS